MNEFGEVVAITAAVRADAEGIGFAIPVNEVRRVVGSSPPASRVAHAHVGVRMVDEDADCQTPAQKSCRCFERASPRFCAGARARRRCGVAMEGESLADAAHGPREGATYCRASR